MGTAKSIAKTRTSKKAPPASKTTTEKGQAFEKKVATWARKKFKLGEVERNCRFKGKIAVRPFEIDIVALKTVSGLVGTVTEVFWIECKDRKATIKRTDIFKFWGSAIDVKKMVPAITWSGLSKEQVKMSWGYLIFVSNSAFDVDAINFAKEHKIACYYYDGKTFQEQK